MKLVYTLFALLISGLASNAQMPAWAWATGGAGNSNHALGITTDKNGYVFACGSFTTSATFGTTVLSQRGIYVAKYDALGNVLAARGADGPSGVSFSYDIAVDTSGNVYVIGNLSDSLKIGGVTLVDQSSGLGALLLLKYDNNLNLLWAKSITGSSVNDAVNGVTVALGPDQHPYIGGTLNGTALFGQTTLTATVDAGFYAKVSKNTGDVTWAKLLSSNNNTAVGKIKVDRWSNVYIMGRYTQGVSFGGATLSGNDPNGNTYLARTDANGNVIWAKTCDKHLASLSINNENIFLLGEYYGTNLSMDTFNLTFQYADYYLAKLDTGGIVKWLKKAGISDSAAAREISVDTANNIYVLGSYHKPLTYGNNSVPLVGIYDVYLARHTADGDIVSVAHAGGPIIDIGYDVHADIAGNIYVCGAYTNAITFGNFPLAATGQNSFIARLNSTLSVPRTEETNSINVYPNPSNGSLILDAAAGKYLLIVYNSAGQNVISMACTLTGKTEINIGDLAEGMYLLELKNDNLSKFAKVVIQH